jgi:hypothetical protein
MAFKDRKKTAFHKKPRKPMKRSAIKRASTKPKSNPKKRIATISTPLPKWIKAIPASKSHGSGTYQKRLWKLTSDYVRIRDFHKYGKCVATGKRFLTWRGANVQAGHLKPYATCNGLYRFDVRNIHAQDGYNNKYGNYDDFRNFEKEVRRRGYDWDLFEKESNSNNGCRLYDSEVIEAMEELLVKMKDLPEQPDYYKRAMGLLNEQ